MLEAAHSFLWKWAVGTILYSADEAALSQLYLATSDEVADKDIRGEYFVPLAEKSWVLHAQGNSTELQRQLWDFSDELLRVAEKNI